MLELPSARHAEVFTVPGLHFILNLAFAEHKRSVTSSYMPTYFRQP